MRWSKWRDKKGKEADRRGGSRREEKGGRGKNREGEGGQGREEGRRWKVKKWTPIAKSCLYATGEQCSTYLSAAVKSVGGNGKGLMISCHYQLCHSTTADEVRRTSFLPRRPGSRLEPCTRTHPTSVISCRFKATSQNILPRDAHMCATRYCRRMLPFVCPSTTLMIFGHRGWVTSKVIIRRVSLGSSLFGALNSAI